LSSNWAATVPLSKKKGGLDLNFCSDGKERRKG
jgi:hypothetical protein